MFAIVKSGSKQYKVKEGDIIDLPLISKKTKKLTLSKVLLLSDANKKTTFGAPYVKNASIEAEVIEADIKDKKVSAMKFKSKKRYKKTLGHRERYTRIKITKINTN